jgi:segregation and condensation protein A
MMTDYKVQLEVFEGPLDLLLYLIQKDEIDIYRIPISRITTQYMQYLDLLKIVVPEVAGEFIVMGATLMYIKSKMLLPEQDQVIDPEAPADEFDPRWDLIRQLVEYKKFKDAASELHQREILQESLFTRQQTTLGLNEPQPKETGLGDVSLFDLLHAFNTVLKRADDEEGFHEISEEHFTVSDKIDFILSLTAVEEKTSFSRLFEGAASRPEKIVTFLALLELIRLRQLRILQTEAFSEIEILRLKPEDSPHTVPTPFTEVLTQQTPPSGPDLAPIN